MQLLSERYELSTLRLFIKNEFGLHARPCAALTLLQRDYFPESHILVADPHTNRDVWMGDLLGLLYLAIGRHRFVDFITMLDEPELEEFRRLLLHLHYVKVDDGMVKKTVHTYDQCFAALKRCTGNREQLLAILRQTLDGNADTWFEDRRDAVEAAGDPGPEISRQAFVLSEYVVHALGELDSALCDDAIRAGPALFDYGTAGLVVIRRVCEGLVRRLCDRHGVAYTRRDSFKDCLQRLHGVKGITDIETLVLDFFRALGNFGAHQVPNQTAVPDAQTAFYIFKMFEALLRNVLTIAVRPPQFTER
ncbi:MAG TPA: hypothetical protein VLV78_04775 [Thermoanaerobaculia bacterium]|nr:hypothetical protein [Thermoanaerobaculia bacterium]